MKKNICKVVIISLIFISISQYANAEKIRDLSLSVEKTNELLIEGQQQQNNPNFGAVGMNNNEGTGFDDGVPLSADMARQLKEINSRANNTTATGKGVIPPPPTGGLVKQNFMAEFCASDYKNKISGNTTFQSCQETQRQQACDRFSRATVSVQRLLSQAIDCDLSTLTFSTGECDGLDAGRLDLLKQYWQDEEMSYTVLFLPDMVTNIVSNCTSRR